MKVGAEFQRLQVRRMRESLAPHTVRKAGVVLDVVETWIAIAEFLADTLDEGSYIGTITLCAVSGDEVLSVDEIIYLAIADVLPCLLG